jgi:hypothetical protein
MPRNIVVTLWTIDTEKRAKGQPKSRVLGVDLDGRLALMAETIEKAAAEMAKQADKDTELAIFLAPEYFFVHCNEDAPARHFLTVDERNLLIERLAKLAGGHQDVLMVPGTIGWSRAASAIGEEERNAMARLAFPAVDGPRMTKDARETRKTLVQYNTKGKGEGEPEGEGAKFLPRLVVGDPGLQVAGNTAVVLHGGNRWLYTKRYESIADGMSKDVPAFVDYKNTMFGPGVNAPLAGTWGKISLGLEICADHEYGSLLVDTTLTCTIHAIVSATVTPFKANAALAAGGWLIDADSQNSVATQDFKKYAEPVSAGGLSVYKLPLD